MADMNHPLYAGTVTRYVFIESYKTTPDDLAARAYEAADSVMIKETCFGLQITGTESEVDRVIEHIRTLDPTHIFVKDRGFPPGDSRRCRANLGGARPGFFGHEYEMGRIRWISRGLEALSAGTAPTDAVPPQRKRDRLDPGRLSELIEQEAA